ncbi:EscU/YscU/HrcU family type III secretion system export apparatus switch protein [Caminibacter sp.]
MKKYTNIKAVALKYKAYEDNAPKIVAKGKGEIAAKIIEKAKEFDIPLFQNELLVDTLLKVESEEIPPKLYEAVAEVFVWLYNIEKNAQLSR